MQYICGTDLRRRAVRDSNSVNGIDYVEVYMSVAKIHTLEGPNVSHSSGVRALLVIFCFKELGLEAITKENVVITGGSRIPNINIDWVSTADRIAKDMDTGISTDILVDLTEEEKEIIREIDRPYERALIVRPSRVGDFSMYSLEFVSFDDVDDVSARRPDSLNNGAISKFLLPNFDVLLSKVCFSFRSSCVSDFDCRPEMICPEELLKEPDIDYMAKDFATLEG